MKFKFKKIASVSGILLVGFSLVALATASYTWTARTTGIGGDPSWIAADSDSTGQNLIVASYDYQRIYISNDSGATWTQRQPASKDWTTVASDSDGSNLIAGSESTGSGRLYTSANSGVNWTERQPAGDVWKNWKTVASDSDGSNLIAGVNNGRLYTSDDGGATWTERQPAGAVDKAWRTVASDADGSNLIASVYNGRIYTSSDSGANWTERQPAGAADKAWYSVDSDSDGSNLIAAVQSGRIYTSSDSGVNWTERQPAGDTNQSWYSVSSDATGLNLIAGVYFGRLYTSSDSGVNWVEQQPAGDANATWISIASDSDSSNFFAVAQQTVSVYTGVLLSNTAPTATIGTPAQVSASNTISFSAVVFDTDSNTSTLQVQYSTDLSTWASSTLGSVTGSTTTVSTVTGQISNIGTNTGTTTLTISWLAGTDLANTYDSSVYLRIKPYDGTAYASGFTTSTAFAVDTRTAATPTGLTIYPEGQTLIRLDWTGNNPTYIVNNTTLGATSSVSTAYQSIASGLSCATSYTFKVLGQSFVGTNSDYTSTVSATTYPCSGGGTAGGGGGSSSAPSVQSVPAVTVVTPIVTAPVASTPTLTQLQSQLAALMQQLQSMQSLRTPAASYSFTSGFGPNSRGEQVRQLQVYLNTHGFPVALSGSGSAGNETSFFGPATTKALLKFQESLGLTPTPWVGPGTRAVLNK